MIDILQDLQRIALTALFNPLFLALLLILFFAGRFFGKLTRRLNIWKILIVAYFAIFLFEPVRDAGPILGGIFLLGIASNHFGTFLKILWWASDLGDIIWAFRYRSAFDDLRRREQELDEREARLRDAERRQAYQQQDRQQKARAGWQEEARKFRQQGKEEQPRQDRSSQSQDKRRKDSQGRGQKTYRPPPQKSQRDKYLETLGLKAGKTYSREEIKKAYRKAAKKTHPDAGGSANSLVKVVNAWEFLMCKTPHLI